MGLSGGQDCRHTRLRTGGVTQGQVTQAARDRRSGSGGSGEQQREASGWRDVKVARSRRDNEYRVWCCRQIVLSTVAEVDDGVQIKSAGRGERGRGSEEAEDGAGENFKKAAALCCIHIIAFVVIESRNRPG